MKNPDYWKKQAKLIAHREEERDFSEIPPTQYGSYARDFAQKGITLLIIGDPKRTIRFLNRSLYLFESKIKIEADSSDLIWLYILKRIFNDFTYVKTHKQILMLLEKEIYNSALRYGQKDIFDLCRNFGFENIPKDEKPHGILFENQLQDIHPYRMIANQFMQMARQFMIPGMFNRARRAAGTARLLCKMAVKKIPMILAKEDSRWEKLENNPELIEQLSREDLYDYRKHRESLTGNISSLVRHGDIIEMVSAQIGGDTESLKRLASKYRKEKKLNSGEAIDKLFGFLDSTILNSRTNNLERAVDSFFQGIFDSEIKVPTENGNVKDHAISTSDKLPASLKEEKDSAKDSKITGIFEAIKDIFTPDYVKKPLELVRNFFDNYINPPGKEVSYIGLVEEIEWVMVRRQLEVFMNRSLENFPLAFFIKEYLG